MLLAKLGALHWAWAFLPGAGSLLAHTGRGDPNLDGPEAPRQHWELLRPPDPCRRLGYLSVNAPLQSHRKLREMDGEASRGKQGGWLLTAPGLRLGIHAPQLCLRLFGSLAVYLAKWQDSTYPARELSPLKALLSCS